MKIKHGLLAILATVCCACASTSELTDKPVQLQPGQGIAAIVLDAPNRITQIKYVAKDPGGSSFEVPDTQGGPSLYLVPVRAGRYCLQHFRYWRTIFESVQDLGCFTAVAGKITYAGTIVPSPSLSGAQTDQQFNPEEFDSMLHQKYSVIVGMYPVTAAPPLPAGVNATSQTDVLSTWVQNITGSVAQGIYVQNNSSWTLEVTDFNLTDCVNTKPACGSRQLNVNIGPFSRKQLMVVEPADAHAAYSYQYSYHYDNVD